MKNISISPSFLMFVSAALLVTPVLIPELSSIIWVALTPFIYATYRTNIRHSLTGVLFIGTVFLTALFYWILYYDSFIFFMVLLSCLPYFALWALLTFYLRRRFQMPLMRMLLPAVCWSALGWIYAATPLAPASDLPFFLEATRFPSLLALFGMAGIGFLIILLNAFFVELMISNHRKTLILPGLIIFLLLLSGLAPPHKFSDKPLVRVSLVQHNFPIDVTWRYQNEAMVLNAYRAAIIQQSKNSELIIFPQYGLPIDVKRQPDFFQNLAEQEKVAILLGTYIPKDPKEKIDEGPQFNSAFLFTPRQSLQEYRAVTAPPFRRIGQITGKEHRPLRLSQDLAFGVMLCYEDVRFSTSFAWQNESVKFLVTLANPGHFLQTLLPFYHLTFDRIRAIETGRFVIRVTPNAYSAIIDPNGRIIEIGTKKGQQILEGTIQEPASKKSMYLTIGPIIPSLSACVVALALSLALTNQFSRARKSL